MWVSGYPAVSLAATLPSLLVGQATVPANTASVLCGGAPLLQEQLAEGNNSSYSALVLRVECREQESLHGIMGKTPWTCPLFRGMSAPATVSTKLPMAALRPPACLLLCYKTILCKFGIFRSIPEANKDLLSSQQPRTIPLTSRYLSISGIQESSWHISIHQRMCQMTIRSETRS